MAMVYSVYSRGRDGMNGEERWRWKEGREESKEERKEGRERHLLTHVSYLLTYLLTYLLLRCIILISDIKYIDQPRTRLEDRAGCV